MNMAKLLVRYRYWFLGITLAIAVVCGFLAFRVNINADMTKYLPDDSNMRAGLQVLSEEFGDMAAQNGADVRVLCEDLSDDEKVEFSQKMRNIPEVTSVTVQENGSRTLYELGVAGSVDQVAMGKEIANTDKKIVTVETSQDAATADGPMLLGALVLLLIILFAMCQSWLEPVLFLASTGIAVLLNIGTNALLPSVSATTNSIVAILQLILSMDYSIILINRFRQERVSTEDSIAAMKEALKRASSSILSSAFTTIVGLMMLLFMKLKIGADLGIVLSKGVLCSLICNFTILPSLILLFEKGIDKSRKKVLQFPTTKMANFSMRFRIPLAILFIVIFVGSYFLHNKTDISFLKTTDSKIEKYFPKKNPVVLVYDNADESKIVSLMDSMMKCDGVEMVLSYPSLLLREYTAPQMVEAIKDMSNMMSHMDTTNMPSIKSDMLSDDVLKVVYYAAHNNGDEITMSFKEMTDFILAQANDPNSLIAKAMDDDFKSKLNMLKEFSSETTPVKSIPDESEINQPIVTPSSSERLPEITTTKPNDESVIKDITTETLSVPSKSPYADTTMIRKPMNYTEMANFLTIDPSQTKMIYKIAGRTSSTMTPHQFIHFVTEDILKRRMLAAMIKSSQEVALRAVQHTMDSALAAANNVTTPIINTVSPNAVGSNQNTVVFPATATDTTQTVAETSVHKPTQTQHKIHQSNSTLSALDNLMNPNIKFNAQQMSKNLALLGENIPEGLINLLYLYYGGNQSYNDSWTMSLESMVNYLIDSVMTDPRFESFIDDDMRSGFGKMQEALIAGIGNMKSKDHGIAVIITNLPAESEGTYSFIDHYSKLCSNALQNQYYSIGESVMLSEMKAGFNHELWLVTILTILAIFVIVAISFRSLLIAAILVSTVMSGVFVNVCVSGLLGGSILYLAYLIVQSILMGAAIDYGILFANYYREKRETLNIAEAILESYKGTIHTILTSGLILILVPAAMSFLVSDQSVADIVRSIGVGALATEIIILFILPGLLAACDKIIVKKKNKN